MPHELVCAHMRTAFVLGKKESGCSAIPIGSVLGFLSLQTAFSHEALYSPVRTINAASVAENCVSV